VTALKYQFTDIGWICLIRKPDNTTGRKDYFKAGNWSGFFNFNKAGIWNICVLLLYLFTPIKKNAIGYLLPLAEFLFAESGCFPGTDK
jgi:hypothetical protein